MSDKDFSGSIGVDTHVRIGHSPARTILSADNSGNLLVNGSINGASTPPRQRFPRPQQTVISAFQGAETWTKSGGGTQSYDTTDFVLGTQSLKFITDGSAGSGFSTTTLGSPIDVSAQNFVIYVKVDDFTKFGSFQVRVGTSGDTTTNYHYFQPAYTSASQRYVEQGLWTPITIPRTADGLTTGGWTKAGTGATLSSINTIKLKFADLGAGSVTIRVNLVATFPQPANGLLTLMADDGRLTQFTQGSAYADRYRIRSNDGLIIENLDSSSYLTTADIYSLRDNSWWEISCHAYSNVLGAQAHSLGYDGLTSSQTEQDVIALKNYLYTNGMPGVNVLALPHGTWSVAGVNPNVLNQMREYFDAVRNTFSTTLETFPPCDSHKLRGYVISSTGGDTAASLLTMIDDAITNKWWLILIYHNIVTTPTLSTDFSIAQWQLLCDGIATRVASGLPVKPIGEVLKSGVAA